MITFFYSQKLKKIFLVGPRPKNLTKKGRKERGECSVVFIKHLKKETIFLGILLVLSKRDFLWGFYCNTTPFSLVTFSVVFWARK